MKDFCELTGDYLKDLELKDRSFTYESTNGEWELLVDIGSTSDGYDVVLVHRYFGGRRSASVFFKQAKLVQNLVLYAVKHSDATLNDMDKVFCTFMEDVKNGRFDSSKVAKQYINSCMAGTMDAIRFRSREYKCPGEFFEKVDVHFTKTLLTAPSSTGLALGRTFVLDGTLKVFIHYKAIEDMCHRYGINKEDDIMNYIFTIMVHEYIHAYQLIEDKISDENEAKLGMIKAAKEIPGISDETLRWAIETLIKEDRLHG